MCGLFGVVNYGGAKPDKIKRLVFELATASETRGTDAGGVAYYTAEDKIRIMRNSGKVSTNGTLLDDEMCTSQIIMGHTRMTTQGVATHNYNNHPFPSSKGTYAMAHNGILSNDDDLAFELGLPDTKVKTDSYIFNRILDEKYDGVVNFENIKAVVEKISGTYNFTLLDKIGNLWIVRHNNPLTIFNIEELGVMIYASTGEIMLTALNKVYDGSLLNYLFARIGLKKYGSYISSQSGEIIRISYDGTIERGTFTPSADVVYSYSKYSRGKSFHNAYDDFDNDYRPTVYRRGASYDDEDEWDSYVSKSSKKNAVATVREIYADAGNVKFTIFGGYEPLRQAIVFNGVEDEVLDYRPSQEKIFSFLLGKMIDNPFFMKDGVRNSTNVPIIITTEELLEPITFKDLKPIMYTKSYEETDNTMIPKLVKFLATSDTWKAMERKLYAQPTTYSFLRNQILAYLLTHFVLAKYDDEIASYYCIDDFSFEIGGLCEVALLKELIKISSFQSNVMLYKYVQCSMRADMLLFTNAEYLFDYADKYMAEYVATKEVQF